jgi:hypothetical protein
MRGHTSLRLLYLLIDGTMDSTLMGKAGRHIEHKSKQDDKQNYGREWNVVPS